MKLTVYSKKVCPHCVNAKNFLKSKNIAYEEIDIEVDAEARQFIQEQGHRTVPQIYLGKELFVEGGWSGLSKMSTSTIMEKLNTNNFGTL